MGIRYADEHWEHKCTYCIRSDNEKYFILNYDVITYERQCIFDKIKCWFPIFLTLMTCFYLCHGRQIWTLLEKLIYDGFDNTNDIDRKLAFKLGFYRACKMYMHLFETLCY